WRVTLTGIRAFCPRCCFKATDGQAEFTRNNLLWHSSLASRLSAASNSQHTLLYRSNIKPISFPSASHPSLPANHDIDLLGALLIWRWPVAGHRTTNLFTSKRGPTAAFGTLLQLARRFRTKARRACDAKQTSSPTKWPMSSRGDFGTSPSHV